MAMSDASYVVKPTYIGRLSDRMEKIYDGAFESNWPD